MWSFIADATGAAQNLEQALGLTGPDGIRRARIWGINVQGLLWFATHPYMVRIQYGPLASALSLKYGLDAGI